MAVQVRSTIDNHTEVFGESASGDIANVRVLHDFNTGLNTTTFCVIDMQVIEHLAVKVVVELHCDRTATPWCSLERTEEVLKRI